MKTLRPAIVAIAALLALGTTGLVGQTWTQLNPGTPPTARRTGAMVYDPITGTVLMHGGLTSGPTAINGQTYAFDGLNWNLLSPANPGPARWGHRMVYDSARGRVVTWGGRSPTTAATAADTWEWDGLTWTQVFPAASPPARAFYGMAYDERRARTVTIGSQSTFNGGQTWEYDGTTWVLVATPTTMVSRESPAVAYDKARGVTVLFGGYNAASPGTMYGDTWEYDGTDWRQLSPATSPSPRYRASMVYDDSRGRLVLHGGFANATASTETWEFDGNTWTLVATGVGPTRTTESYMAYDATNTQIVHFGGSAASGVSAETWSYVGARTALFAPYGRGCAGSAGVPSMVAATLPILGTTFVANVTNLPASGTFTTVALGFSNTSWLGTPLPIDLGGIGLPGCSLELSVDYLFPSPIVGGQGVFVVGLPNDPLLAGISFYLQAYTDDTAAPNGIGSVSQAGHGVLGY